jgi:hypothetical protein
MPEIVGYLARLRSRQRVLPDANNCPDAGSASLVKGISGSAEDKRVDALSAFGEICAEKLVGWRTY